MTIKIRSIEAKDYPFIKEFLYEAIFVPEGEMLPSPDIVEAPELRIYYENFGNKAGDIGFVAEKKNVIIGMVWTRIIPDYGHIDDETPSLSIALLNEYRNQGIGKNLLEAIFDELRAKDYKYVSLSCQKDNQASRLYIKLGFDVYEDKGDELVMRKTL